MTIMPVKYSKRHASLTLACLPPAGCGPSSSQPRAILNVAVRSGIFASLDASCTNLCNLS